MPIIENVVCSGVEQDNIILRGGIFFLPPVCKWSFSCSKFKCPAEPYSARFPSKIKIEGAQQLPVCTVSHQLRGSVSSLLQTVARDEDMSWARREQQALGRVPSRGGRRTVLYGSFHCCKLM